MITSRYDLDPPVAWPWVREQVAKMTPMELADKLGPRFLGIRFETMPGSIPLKNLADNYRNHGTATETTKGTALNVWDELVAASGAKTLDDLTTAKLMTFRAAVAGDPKRQSDADKTWFHACVSTVIGFGLKAGFDAAEIAAATPLHRMFLWS